MDKLLRIIEGYSEDSIMSWANTFRPELFNPYLADDMDMPIMQAVQIPLPEEEFYETIQADKVLRKKYSAEDVPLVHYFDVRDAERAWKDPESHLQRLQAKQAEFVVAPAYSAVGGSLPIWWFQTYRSRVIGQWWQRQGLNVIPCVEWGSPDTYDIAFRGLPEQSVLAVAIDGWDNAMFLQDFQDGIDYMAEHLHPIGLLLFINRNNGGGKTDENLILQQIDFRGIKTVNVTIRRQNVMHDDAQKNSWAMRLNLELFNPWRADAWDIPTMDAVTIPEPNEISMCGFNQVLSCRERVSDKICHFYVEDYQFERCWNNMEMYAPALEKFRAVLTPDFSLYENFPLPIWWFQTFRNRLLGQYWQDWGLHVIPCVNWGGPDTYDIVFRGIPKKSAISFSTIGWEKAGKIEYQEGIDYMIETLQPKQFLVYGRSLDWADYHGIEVVQAQNDNLASARDRYKEQRLQRLKAEEAKWGRQLSLFDV